MARPLRIEYPDAVYHVMNRGKGRQKVYLRQKMVMYLAYEGGVDEAARDRWVMGLGSYEAGLELCEGAQKKG